MHAEGKKLINVKIRTLDEVDKKANPNSVIIEYEAKTSSSTIFKQRVISLIRPG